MAEEDQTTSCIDFISSLHDRQRRRERNLDKRDLQAAVKYGKEYPIYNNNIKVGSKYVFGDVTYIVKNGVAVTSYAEQLPLDKAPMSKRDKYQVSEAKKRMKSLNIPATTHTIFIVDQSASMNNADVDGHRSRSRGVYYAIATNIIAPLLAKRLVSYTDTISLIEMRTDSSVTICKEPISWELYNKIVDLADEPLRGSQHGNYIPSFECTYDLICRDYKLPPTTIFFLSDGKPSDSAGTQINYVHPAKFDIILDNKISRLCKYLRNHSKMFNFIAFGFGSSRNDFSTLRQIVALFKRRGATESLFGVGFDNKKLKLIMNKLITTLVSTRAQMSSIGNNSLLNAVNSTFEVEESQHKVKIQKESLPEDMYKRELDPYNNKDDFNFYFIKEHNLAILRRKGKTKWARKRIRMEVEETKLQNINAVGIAIKKKYFAEGAQRIVHLMTEIDKDGYAVGEKLVAKFPKQNIKNMFEFQTIFLKTQEDARRLARKFNEQLDFLRIPNDIPRVEFENCNIYKWNDGKNKSGDNVGISKSGENYKNANVILVERFLNINLYQKYNDNKGGIFNRNKDDIDDSKSEYESESEEYENGDYENEDEVIIDNNTLRENGFAEHEHLNKKDNTPNNVDDINSLKNVNNGQLEVLDIHDVTNSKSVDDSNTRLKLTKIECEVDEKPAINGFESKKTSENRNAGENKEKGDISITEITMNPKQYEESKAAKTSTGNVLSSNESKYINHNSTNKLPKALESRSKMNDLEFKRNYTQSNRRRTRKRRESHDPDHRIEKEPYKSLLNKVLDDDIPQVFSHWSIRYTKRELLICDIQGVLTTGRNPVFKLTDPAIHSSSKYKWFGATDHGKKGRNKFTQSHKCSPLCYILRLKTLPNRRDYI